MRRKAVYSREGIPIESQSLMIHCASSLAYGCLSFPYVNLKLAVHKKIFSQTASLCVSSMDDVWGKKHSLSIWSKYERWLNFKLSCNLWRIPNRQYDTWKRNWIKYQEKSQFKLQLKREKNSSTTPQEKQVCSLFVSRCDEEELEQKTTRSKCDVYEGENFEPLFSNLLNVFPFAIKFWCM